MDLLQNMLSLGMVQTCLAVLKKHVGSVAAPTHCHLEHLQSPWVTTPQTVSWAGTSVPKNLKHWQRKSGSYQQENISNRMVPPIFTASFEVTVVIPNAFAESLTVSEYVGLVSNFRQRKFQPIPTYRNFKALVGFKHFHKFHKQHLGTWELFLLVRVRSSQRSCRPSKTATLQARFWTCYANTDMLLCTLSKKEAAAHGQWDPLP
ncbi:hypothetical protein Anapl_16472 [Anas platyrhynchos]|uniref:Uncharacterized protein n=1 Tax=Anas platyrhynchos TaxID=8839 RepID=R0JKT5_ANAPL|nr:hypothetical protein Anapl_16472 [Anas platyrhynchos]